MDYAFSRSHQPIGSTSTIWALKSSRCPEYAAILHTLQRHPDHLAAIVEACSISLPGLSVDTEPSLFLDVCCRANVSFGWLIQLCLQHLPIHSPILRLLNDLMQHYSPLRLVAPDNEQPGQLQVLDLGSSTLLQVRAEGVPQPQYSWFFLREEATDEWVDLKIESNAISIVNFSCSDAGLYRCFINHWLPVSDEPISAGLYSPAFELRVAKGSISVVSHPDSCRLAVGGGGTMCCSAISDLPLMYQWFHDDQPLLGQSGNVLSLKCVSLESAGQYFCEIANECRRMRTTAAVLEVFVSDAEPRAKSDTSDEDEKIVIVEQPVYCSNTKARVGDKISLSCVAVCKFPLLYEWMKQAVSKDLISANSVDQFLGVEPVCLGPQLQDTVSDCGPSPINGWVYFCVITCPTTDQRIKSQPVHVAMSTYASPERSLPEFKVALVICQEEYTCSTYFHTLKAPKNDGQALIRALKQLNFCVMAFSNLTLQEVRNAIQMFCSFVDDNCYALFYYNGHALGYGSDVYLVAQDTDLTQCVELSHALLWHGEVESMIDTRRPLLCIIIYDSCRDNPPDVIADLVKSARHQPVLLQSSFCIGYGTRPSMRNFEKLDKHGTSEGLYMKYLLKHLTRPDLTVSGIFENLFSSFTQEEDGSVVEKMKPEYKCSTKQLFRLNAPLRHLTCSRHYERFFRLLRYEAAMNGMQAFDGVFSYSLGIGWNGHQPFWVTGRSGDKHHGLLQLRLSPSPFLNEALLSVHFQPTDEQVSWPHDLRVQVISCDAKLMRVFDCPLQSQRAYQPCAKKPGSLFSLDDGPDFRLHSPAHQVGRCQLLDLQKICGDLKFRVLLRHSATPPLLCKGVMSFPVPLCRHFPYLKLKNI